MMLQLTENRVENDHLHYFEETAVGEKKSKLFLVKLQSMWFKEDIERIE